jgi:chromosome segregation protein
MKVTDLRVTGFKSFVDPVALKIEPGLTGIVGPNGCGKSNILESLRWVMGATSARALRGGEMDDVIFAGTDKRPQRDIAEVSIVLDNSDGRAPAPFDTAPTLEVTRRIRRAAGSSFKINGKEVRARDVQLLFADASTGANSPALVRQNQVSELINAKPENRRRILEEAAGIAGLYARRHEAELKLRGAQTNLERLDDIIAGLNDQVSSLRRQARQAARYRTLADDIRGLEAFLFAKRWEIAQLGIEAAKAAQILAQTALADATLAANAASKAAEGADSGIAALREEQAIAEAVLRRLEGQRFALERDLKTAQDALETANADLARISADQVRETSLLDDAKATLEHLLAQQAALPQDENNQGALEQAQAILATANQARQTAEDALTAALTARASAQGERTAQMRACEDARGQLSRRHSALLQAQANFDRQKASLPDQQALDLAKREAEIVAAAAAEAGEKADATEKHAEEAANAEAKARETARQSQNALDRLSSEISALEAATRQVKTGTWPKVLDTIKPAAGYERALAAALGDELEASLDRGAPMAWVGGKRATVTWPAGTKVLSDHIDEAPDALASRLASVALVEVGAFEAFDTIPTGGRVVTLSGDMRRWDGFVRRANAIAGSAILLEQRTKLTTLMLSLPQAKGSAQSDASANATARAMADQSRAAAKAARADAPRAFAAVSSARDRVMRLEAELARAQANVDQAAVQVAAMQEECEQASALVEVTAQLLAALPDIDDDQPIAALQAKVAQTRADANSAQSALSTLQNDMRARAARRDGLANDIASWEKRAAQAVARIDTLAREQSQATARQNSAMQAPSDIEARRKDILTQTPAAQSRKAAADDALASLESAIRAGRERERVAQNVLADCREARALAQTRFESDQIRLSELEEEIKRTVQLSPQDCEKRARDTLGASFDTLTTASGESRLAKLLYDREALGGVNLRADEEVAEQETRLSALIADKDDLSAAIAKLRSGVDQINAEGKERLLAAFEEVHEHFRVLFAALFDGGVAELRLTESDDPLGGGLEVYACPPGKKLQSLTLMSGGEQALTASALIFAVFLSNPSPICVLDEVDAPLDDSNVDRYCRLLNEMRERTQTRFIVITHHPITMARMDRLFGITMAERGVSQVVSVDLTRAEELIASA